VGYGVKAPGNSSERYVVGTGNNKQNKENIIKRYNKR